eukprot:jgi/Astpho2/7265/Aster-01571
MVAIRSLLLAGAFAGLSTAAQKEPGRRLLQESPPPPTGDAVLLNTVQQSLQGTVGGAVSDATGLTASLTGIGGRHLLQGPLPPVTDQLVTALTSAGSDVVGAGTGLLGTLEESPPPLTGDAVLLNAVQQSLQGTVGGAVSDATGFTGSLTGIGGRHLLQGPPPPVTDQLLTALTDTGNDVVGAGTGLLTTLEVLPTPPAR